jgi:hypothetical protein
MQLQRLLEEETEKSSMYTGTVSSSGNGRFYGVDGNWYTENE